MSTLAPKAMMEAIMLFLGLAKDTTTAPEMKGMLATNLRRRESSTSVPDADEPTTFHRVFGDKKSVDLIR